LHPEQHRPIAHREAARLQSFPDSFQFMGSKIEIAKQIGNAVPPLLAEKIADCVDRLLLDKNRHTFSQTWRRDTAGPGLLSTVNRQQTTINHQP
jgi:DNA (cytosine-5)-methyltransferase 1